MTVPADLHLQTSLTMEEIRDAAGAAWNSREILASALNDLADGPVGTAKTIRIRIDGRTDLVIEDLVTNVRIGIVRDDATVFTLVDRRHAIALFDRSSILNVCMQVMDLLQEARTMIARSKMLGMQSQPLNRTVEATPFALQEAAKRVHRLASALILSRPAPDGGRSPTTVKIIHAAPGIEARILAMGQTRNLLEDREVRILAGILPPGVHVSTARSSLTGDGNERPSASIMPLDWDFTRVEELDPVEMLRSLDEFDGLSRTFGT